MSGSFSFAEDVSLFLLEDEGVVFCEGPQELYALNTTATYIWCCCEEGMEQSQIAASVAQTFGTRASEAEGQVRDILVRWRELGLFADADRKREPERSAASPGEAARPSIKPPPGPPAFRAERCYRVLNRIFRIRFTSRAQEERVHPLFAHLEVPGSAPSDTVLDIITKGGGHVLIVDSTPVYRCDSVDQIAPLANRYLYSASVEKGGYSFAIHAAAVSDGKKCLLLPGAAGTGKTSLAAALMHSGFRYLTDDLAILDRETLRVRGAPFSLCVKDDGLDLLAPYYPELPGLPAHLRWDGKRARYLTPPASAFHNEPERSYPAGWIVFPFRVLQLPTSLEPLSPAQALRRLVAECFTPVRLDRVKVRSLVRWIQSAACFEMPMSSLPEAVKLLRQLCR